jgi:hypothetical protein
VCTPLKGLRASRSAASVRGLVSLGIIIVVVFVGLPVGAGEGGALS